jgi:NAD+ diphosphatase
MTANHLASSGVDRAAHLRRSEDSLTALRAHPDARVLVVRPPYVLLSEGTTPAAVLAGDVSGELFLLGVEDGVATFAVDATEELNGTWVTLMEIGAVLDRRQASLLAQALGLANWHRRHRFCGGCGAPTVMGEAGYLRTCPSCAALHFPRLDPAVIMLVSDGSRCVLGRQAAWPANMFSALAGFVEPGESLEDAVAREVLEEVGLTVTDVSYHSSQPWPFPSSLMLGFFASPVDGQLQVDHSELADARWFSRDEIAKGVASGSLMLPGPISIARQLVDSWLHA